MIDGLLQFFLAYLMSGRKYVAMPSQVADDLWHDFVLYTRDYQAFRQKAFGGFLHHTPAVAPKHAQRSSNAGLRRVWWYSCKDEGIDPYRPAHLPLLFALDAQLNIAGGFRYVPDCEALVQGWPAAMNCGGHFSSTAFDGTTDGLGDSGGDGGGGDGGVDGCGGGCGGDRPLLIA